MQSSEKKSSEGKSSAKNTAKGQPPAKKSRAGRVLKRILLAVVIVVAALLVTAGILYYRFTRPAHQDGSATGDAIAMVEQGQLQGLKNNDIYAFLGVPYASVAKRFVPATAPQSWEGVRDATQYGPISPQGSMFGMSSGGSSDNTDNACQNLNIWTPALADGGKRPVMVWLHGGGFSTGSANENNYNGENLARDGDVVVVSVNHRLNVFGYLDLSAYGDEYQYSGNAGLTDIEAALQWIHANIAAFGGDPDNITLFGQSGGGAKVLAMMSSPYTNTLFQKGIVESGATETMGVSFASQEVSRALTGHILENLDITISPDATKDEQSQQIEKLQTVSVDDLESAANTALQTTAEEFQLPAALGSGYGMEWGPVIDGDYLPTSPVVDAADGSFAAAGKDIPLLIGSNIIEWAGFTPSLRYTNPTQEQKDAFATAYPNEDPDTLEELDTLLRLPILKITSHKADQGGAPVYSYIFTKDGSYHGAEIPYVFDHQSGALNKTITDAWVSFARDGVPTSDNLPAWEPYTREGGAVMLLDDASTLVHHHDEELLHLLVPDYVW